MRAIAILLAATPLLAACPRKAGGLQLQSASEISADEARDDFACKPASTERRFFCTRDKALLGQEATLLGTVYKVEPVGGVCPEPLSAAEQREPIVPGLDKHALTVSNAVSTQVDLALVKREVSANVQSLAFLASSLTGEAVASVELLRTTRAVIEDKQFNDAVAMFAMRHPTACRLYVATGYAADYFTARVFTAATAKGGGGVYGVNVGGTYFASDDSIRRDYQWAISITKVDVGTTGNKALVDLVIEPKLQATIDTARVEVFASVPGLI